VLNLNIEEAAAALEEAAAAIAAMDESSLRAWTH
jgi:hypothetical protein